MTRQDLFNALASSQVRISREDAIEMAERKEWGLVDRYKIVLHDAGTWTTREYDAQTLEQVWQIITTYRLKREKVTVFVNHFQKINRSRVFTAKAVLA